MGRMKNAIGTLLYNAGDSVQGEWVKEIIRLPNGRKKFRRIAVIRTSWMDPVTVLSRVFVQFSPDRIQEKYSPYKDQYLSCVYKEAQDLLDLLRFTDLKCVGLKRYQSNDVIKYSFNTEADAERFVQIVQNFDSGAIAYVEPRYSSYEDKLDLNIVERIVHFRDEDMIGRYYIKDGTIHLAFKYKGQRQISSSGNHYYEYPEEFYTYFSIENYGTSDECMGEPYVLDDVRDASDVDKLFLEAFGNPSNLVRLHGARMRARESIVREISFWNCPNHDCRRLSIPISEKKCPQCGAFPKMDIRPDKLFVTARFNANDLTAVEKVQQEKGDQIALKWFRAEHPEVTAAEIVNRWPHLLKFLADELGTPPPQKRGKTNDYSHGYIPSVMKRIKRTRDQIVTDSPVGNGDSPALAPSFRQSDFENFGKRR